MKAKSKAILLTLCAVMLIAVSMLGTMAYLTSQDSAVNTFTVGSVKITLDEKDVDSPDSEARDQENTYHLMPGQEYTKDPTVHVDAASESCYLFVQVDNQISAIEAATTETMVNGSNYVPIAQQITANGWTPLEGTAGVYYREYTKDQVQKDFEVFGNFMISGDVDADTLAAYAPVTDDNTTLYKSILITGYAVQKDGFSTAADAWAATFGKAADE